MSAVARRYARAGVETALQAGGLDAADKMLAGLRAFRDLYVASHELRQVLQNPALKDARAATLASVMERVNLADAGRGLITLLSERGRLAVLPALVEAAEELVDEHAGRLRAKVLTAIALTDDQAARVCKALEKRFDKPLQLDIVIDPSVLGGLVCHVGDVTIDSSLNRQLELLGERLQTLVGSAGHRAVLS